jgi:hypothetical protein
MSENNQDENILNRSSVFVPFESLTRGVINSIVSVATTFRRPNFDYSERTLLIFLLEIKKKLTEIENKIREGGTEIDPQLIQQTQNVQGWLVDTKKQPLNWRELRRQYDRIANQNCDAMARYYQSTSAEPYFELKFETVSCV